MWMYGVSMYKVCIRYVNTESQRIDRELFGFLFLKKQPGTASSHEALMKCLCFETAIGPRTDHGG